MIRKTYSFEKDGAVNDVYTLSNASGAEVDILTYGGRITRISVPDKHGNFADVIVGCKRVEDYYAPNPYFGATIGRYGNRIGNAEFSLNGKRYLLEKNDKDHSLHGGIEGDFSRKIWQASVDGDSLVLSHVSPDGEGGFPATLWVQVRFTFTNDNELRIDYFAKSDGDTLCNLTNHSYFNLGGQDTVLSHELMIKAHEITAIDDDLIPHGEFVKIDGTPYSFMPAKPIGKDIASSAQWIALCNGYDFNYCIARETERDLEHCAYVYDKQSGRRMDCYTTLYGVQLYTACSTGGFQGKKDYVNHCALCLETQGYPNSPNCPAFPSTVLKAGEKYAETTVYKFSTVKDD